MTRNSNLICPSCGNKNLIIREQVCDAFFGKFTITTPGRYVICNDCGQSYGLDKSVNIVKHWWQEDDAQQDLEKIKQRIRKIHGSIAGLVSLVEEKNALLSKLQTECGHQSVAESTGDRERICIKCGLSDYYRECGPGWIGYLKLSGPAVLISGRAFKKVAERLRPFLEMKVLGF